MRCGHPAASEFYKLIPHSQVISKSSEPNKFFGVAHALVFGSHSDALLCLGGLPIKRKAVAVELQKRDGLSFFDDCWELQRSLSRSARTSSVGR